MSTNTTDPIPFPTYYNLVDVNAKTNANTNANANANTNANTNANANAKTKLTNAKAKAGLLAVSRKFANL